MKYVARLNGWELCSYCHRLLIAIIRHNIRVLLESPGRSIGKVMEDWIYVTYSSNYNTQQNRIVPFIKDTPVLLLDDTLYVGIAHWKTVDMFLREYFRHKWQQK